MKEYPHTFTSGLDVDFDIRNTPQRHTSLQAYTFTHSIVPSLLDACSHPPGVIFKRSLSTSIGSLFDCFSLQKRFSQGWFTLQCLYKFSVRRKSLNELSETDGGTPSLLDCLRCGEKQNVLSMSSPFIFPQNVTE